jgi:predicted transcriptional regulator
VATNADRGTPSISEAERQVMEVVWAASAGARVEDIRRAAPAAAGWTDSTLRTLIHRLMRKGVLVSERRAGGGVAYRAVVERAAYLAGEADDLIDRLFDGRLSALVRHVARCRPLTAEERARLRRLVADLDASDED